MIVAPTPAHGRRPHRHEFELAAVVVLVLLGVGALLLTRYDIVKESSRSNGDRGSGIAATQTREVGPFRSLELAGSNVVTVRVGGRQSVVVHADDNLLGRVTTVVKSGNLAIGNTPGSFTIKQPMRVEVTVPSLNALALTGSGVISVSGIKTPRLTVTVPGSGVLRASGNAKRLAVTLAGSGEVELGELVAREVQAIVSGSGRIVVTATKSLNASVPGTGAILFSGNPAVTSSVTGSGAVIRG